MANAISISGGQPSRQTRAASLWNETFSIGLVTQRNPLRGGSGSYLLNKLYGSKSDGMLDGLNVEISNRLTVVRRPGSSVYNSQTFPRIDNFYPFRLFGPDTEAIKVMADTASVVYDATGPSTKTVVFTKSAGAGEGYFQSVGNTLYFGDGVDQLKWVQSPISWTASTAYTAGQYIVDTNGNLQVVSTAGTSGTVQPTWNMTLQGTTSDNSVIWTNHGSAVENWGIVAPTTAPTVTQIPNGFGSGWTASVYRSSTQINAEVLPSFITILDGSGNLQVIRNTSTPPYTTGSSAPSFNPTLGGATTDGLIIWGNAGPSAWVASATHVTGDIVVGSGNFFRCITAGTSAASAPTWPVVVGLTVNDGSVVWQNIGIVQHWSDIGANTSLGSRQLVDSNGYYEGIYTSGVSGSTAPTWSTIQGGLTTDGTAVWINEGPFAPASTGAWYYAYAYKNSITGAVSTASPVSTPITLRVNSAVLVMGAGSTDPQVDTIVIYRTVQGGSPATLLELAEIPNPPSGNWTYTDTTPDTGLDDESLAAIADANDPPPAGLTKMTYHLGRIWGVVNNAVYFSGGPDTTEGNGNEAFPPANVFVFPDAVNRLYPTTQGLFVFTVSDVYLIQGTTTATFFSVPFLIGLGLQNYNAFDVNGATVYLFTSDYQLVSLDLSSGVNEVGFPIGDQFVKMSTGGYTTSLYNASTARVSWHIAGSADKGLYVSDFNTGWFRLYPTPAPEQGLTWTPFAGIIGGTSQVQSIETSAGTHNLLIGPQTSGPILMRDSSVFTDNGSSYDAYFLFGSIVLAQPGQLAELVFLTTDSIAVGNPPVISVQLDEIAPFSAGLFEILTNFVADPPELSASTSIWGRRYYFSQTQDPALCRHFQIRFVWGPDTVRNELLSLTAFGLYSQEL